MTKTIISGLLATTIMASIALPAFAAGGQEGNRGHRDGRHGPSIERMMENFDTNKDGSISPDEVLQHHADIFTSVDADDDGELTKDELGQLREMRKEHRKQARENMDRDDDGKRDKKRHAKRGDHAEKGSHKDGDGKHGSRHGKKGRNHHGPDFSRLDADNNGTVSMEEFTSNSDRMFKHLDRNGDGAINKDDFGRKRADAGSAGQSPAVPEDSSN